MSEIHESLTVLCPFDEVERALQTYVAALPVEDGKSLVSLRVTAADLVIERQADLTLTHSHAYTGFDIMKISWAPHDGGIYPRFNGTLSVEDMGGNYCRFDLDGGYVPPFGIAGMMFDSVVGHRIAVAAARTLLDEIRVGVEIAFTTGMRVA